MCVCRQAEGYEFEFPDLFKEKVTESERTAEEFKKVSEEADKFAKQNWKVQELPPWFQ